MRGTFGVSFSIREDEEKGIPEISVENSQVSVNPRSFRNYIFWKCV
ncbi:MAG: hypothetical protein JST26_13865 [Bacteroidetes bacterium]|nr:hypothetical protein [Bacteroidota bacterium]